MAIVVSTAASASDGRLPGGRPSAPSRRITATRATTSIDSAGRANREGRPYVRERQRAIEADERRNERRGPECSCADHGPAPGSRARKRRVPVKPERIDRERCAEQHERERRDPLALRRRHERREANEQ